ncbi:MAG: hypothetical protein GC179_01915 [Anaerolineaceae bacterium]|nr:hypothetical protein [Anaerolineaceae bacterium]
MPTVKQLKQLHKQLIALRKNKSNITCKKMEKFANACGRHRHDIRGKEPTYFSEWIENSKPLTIPHHTGRNATLKGGTAGNILDFLEKDLLEMIDKLSGEHGGNDE